MHDVAVSLKVLSENNLLFKKQEEEVGLRMLPSAFLSELQEGHKTYKGMSNVWTKLKFTCEPVMDSAVWMQ